MSNSTSHHLITFCQSQTSSLFLSPSFLVKSFHRQIFSDGGDSIRPPLLFYPPAYPSSSHLSVSSSSSSPWKFNPLSAPDLSGGKSPPQLLFVSPNTWLVCCDVSEGSNIIIRRFRGFHGGALRIRTMVKPGNRRRKKRLSVTLQGQK